MPVARVVVKDRGYAKLQKNLRQAYPSLSVGVHGNEEVQKIATFYEFGLGVPERSFLRSWFDTNRRKIRADLRTVAERTIKGGSRTKFLKALGRRYVTEIQDRILEGIAPALKPATIARKEGHIATPLVTTRARLLSAIVAMLEGEVLT